jgi:hypothetical protein
MNGRLTLTITTPAEKTERDIMACIRTKLNTALAGAAAAVKVRLGDVCESLIERSPEYISLLSAELKGEFGLRDPSARLNDILSAIKMGIRVDPVRVTLSGTKLSGGMVARMVQGDYRNLLSLAAAEYTSQPSGERIPWLDWLLVGGDQVKVFGYEVFTDLTEIQRSRSRSGLALMKKGQGWRVPPWAAGYPANNFLTRSFDVSVAEQLITNVFEEEIQKRL